MTRRLITAVLVTAGLALAACGSGSGSGSAGSTPAASATSVTFTETEFKIDPAKSTLKPGSYVFQVQNQGKFAHDLHIATPDGSELAHTDLISAGGSGSLQVTLKSGTYMIWCAVDSHRANGMEGTVTVS